MKRNKVNICGHQIEYTVDDTDVGLTFTDVRFETYNVEQKLEVVRKIMLYITREGLLNEWAKGKL